MDIKQLRQKILDLAIRGKLVPQDPNDEPASVLLERVKAEKERLIAEGKIKRSKKSAASSDKPHYADWDLPSGWKWCVVDDFAYVAAGSTPSKDSFVGSGIPYIKMYNLRNQQIDFDFRPQYIKDDVHNGKLKRSRTEIGDLIMNIVGPPLGKLAIIPDSLPQSNFNQAAVLIRPLLHKNVIVKYLFYYLSQMSEINSISTKGSAGQVNISLTQSQNMRIALPPLQEQQRIVNEIEHLWKCLDHVDEEARNINNAVERIKTKLLELAIMGKLVPQDPADEPAVDLLKRVNPNAVVSTDTSHYSIPNTWIWVKLSDIFEINPKNHNNDDEDDCGFVPMSYVQDGYSGEHTFEVRKWGKVKKGYSHFQNGDIGVAKISPCFENLKSTIFHSLPNNIGAGTTELVIMRGKEIFAPFFLYLFKSPWYISKGTVYFKGVVGQQRVSRDIFTSLEVPLPPLNEQKRISAKVDELFAVIDQIQQSLE